MLKNLQDFSDNDNRPQLGLKIKSANSWQWDWDVIEDDLLNRNISYHLQYIQFLVELYNNYRIYLAIESLVCKDIIVHINSIIEASLYYTVYKASGKIKNQEDQEEYYKLINQDDKEKYYELINQACKEFHIISSTMVDLLHWLRKQRNLQHIQGEDDRELDKYNIDDGNKAIELLRLYKKQLDEYYSSD